MTKQLIQLTILVLLVVAFINNPSYATDEKGDTLVIHQEDQLATPWNEIVAADTNADGSRSHTVYELDPDGFYPLSGTLTAATYDLHIVGGKRAAGQSRPVILAADPFGGWFMLSGGRNITIKGVHMMQCANTLGGGITGWARSGVELTGVDSRVVFHDNIWDFNTGFAALMTKNGVNLTVTNCLFRFSKPVGESVWAGQGLDISSATIDTAIIKNCTWYGGGPFMLKTWQSTENLFRMDHCTIVDFVQWPIHGSHWVNAEFTNNLFYNAYTMGEDSAMIVGQDLDHLPFGVINIDTIYFVDTLGNIDATREASRNLLVSNNNNFLKQNIKDYWAIASDPAEQDKYHFFVAPDPAVNDGFMNSRTLHMFEDDATWPGLVFENTTSLDPEFEDYFDYSDTLINFSKFHYSYAWPEALPTQFMSDPDGEPSNPTDPMVYNLKITNAALRTASTTGGPIGDLTWELTDGYNNTEIVTGVKEEDYAVPNSFSLKQNYPNPFNPTTNIRFAIPEAGLVSLKVYNVIGEEVADILNEYKSAGTYTVDFNAANLPSGVYFYTLGTGTFSETKKMILLK